MTIDGSRRHGFFVIEGPNGVGKTTISQYLTQRLSEMGIAVHSTTEPSDTTLGNLLRRAEMRLTPRALALAVAADRCEHTECEIAPALAAGMTVISDRYVQSSLVLQRIDSIDLPTIWQYNQPVLAPTASFYLTDTATVIRRRLTARPRLSRLEQAGGPEVELDLYERARIFLDGHGWHQLTIDCHDRSPGDIVARIIDHINRTAR